MSEQSAELNKFIGQLKTEWLPVLMETRALPDDIPPMQPDDTPHELKTKFNFKVRSALYLGTRTFIKNLETYGLLPNEGPVRQNCDEYREFMKTKEFTAGVDAQGKTIRIPVEASDITKLNKILDTLIEFIKTL